MVDVTVDKSYVEAWPIAWLGLHGLVLGMGHKLLEAFGHNLDYSSFEIAMNKA